MDPLNQRRLQILEDTVKFYNLSNRAFDKEQLACVYYDKDTKRSCAVGRLIENKELALSLGTMPVNGIFRLLPEDVQNLGRNFLTALQGLHDRGELWTYNGLNLEGIKHFNQLKRHIELGSFDKHE